MKTRQIYNSGIAFFAALLLATIAPSLAKTQEKSATKPPAAEQSAKPSPEMEKLKFYLGTWDFTENYGNGSKNTGVYISKPGPGGNSLQNSFHSQGPVGDFEGLLMMTWDPREKAYKNYVFGNGFPGCLVQTGNFEGDLLVYHAEIAMGDQRVSLRNTTRFTAPDHIVSEQFVSVGGQPEKLFVHVEAVKRAEK